MTQIDQNAKTYADQVQKILFMDPEHIEVRYNGEWFSKCSFVDVMSLLTVARTSIALE